jgi:uncharacterized Ntn-hydrolase superfamily protein
MMSSALLARCSRTGQLGLAVASESMAIGRCCFGSVRSNLGVTITLGKHWPQNNRLVLNLLAQGLGVQAALHAVAGNDPGFEESQFAVVDRAGGVAVHGPAGHRTGDGYAVLADPELLDAMAARFESQPQDDLDERLLGALEAASKPGWRSAALVVWGRRDFNDMDLRVDLHDRPVEELRRAYADYKPTAQFYDERARNPRDAISAKEFAAKLRKGQP